MSSDLKWQKCQTLWNSYRRMGDALYVHIDIHVDTIVPNGMYQLQSFTVTYSYFISTTS